MAILEKDTQARPHVVIIGGGFGGLYAARSLAKHPVDITIIDRDNYHLFQPLLYQVATAALSTGDIASPIRSILRKFKNVRVIMGEVTDIDLDGKRIMTENGDYHYDYLVNAAGARSAYFGHDEWEKFAPGLKTMEDALEIRRRIFTAYETAERLPEESAERDAYLTFICIGGGPTGVEMAGSIVEVATQTLKADFRSIDPRKTRVVLLQSGDRILPDYPKDLSDSARRQLLEMGVEVRTHSRVTDINADGVYVGELFIPCKTVIWGAGVAASTIGAKMGAPVDRGGRVIVNADMSVLGHSNAFVIGDLANFDHGKKGQLPGIAPVAIQMGVAVAGNIVADIAGQPMKDFSYLDKGQIATIGRNSAVGLLFGVHAKGFIAWLMWLLIHIYFLVGFENRAFVMFNWIYSYLSYNRSARLITDVAYKHN